MMRYYSKSKQNYGQVAEAKNGRFFLSLILIEPDVRGRYSGDVRQVLFYQVGFYKV